MAPFMSYSLRQATPMRQWEKPALTQGLSLKTLGGETLYQNKGAYRPLFGLAVYTRCPLIFTLVGSVQNSPQRVASSSGEPAADSPKPES